MIRGSEGLLVDSGISGLGVAPPIERDADHYRFPFADTVSIAADFYPGDRRPWHTGLAEVLNGGALLGRRPEPPTDPDQAGSELVDGRYLADPDHGVWIESTTPDRGPRFFLRIAPGNVQVLRRDQSRVEATRARLSERRAIESKMAHDVDMARRDTPMALMGWVHIPDDERKVANQVVSWSKKSQQRLIKTIGSLDLAPIVGRQYPPAMLTLTLPGDWLAVCPDAAAGSAIIKRFAMAYSRKWDEPLRCIWKREFQSRGAPHWHLWLSPPADHWTFARWVSRAWADALHIDQSDSHGRQEYRNSVAAGTGVDYRQAADARDPRSLAMYFLKETLGGEGKAYQNRVPAEWAGQSVGRFWGTKGLDQVVAEVPMSHDDGVRVWRALRRVRAQDLIVKRALRCAREHDHTRRCFRRQRRAASAPASAGWVAARSGPDLAIAISRLTDPPAAGRFGWFSGPSLAQQLLAARGYGCAAG